ncbi:hypothetical protein [Cognatiyoonia sp. IB215182]|uniref:hypothetical protein n=1 Tax=Cognatiyoonia sp. IB215182 TaxID=3097353 RepID=UPI002A0BD710|nr:hypothetical protein [Cognatiyoonia sp. IB215182]MDX8355122.1 hypothetical protein [Cognatiyoonia sp. IB215182]
MASRIDSMGSADLSLLHIGEPNQAGGGNDDGTIGGHQFEADTGRAPESANRSRMKEVADFFVKQPNNLASGLGKFVGYVQDKLPPRFGGTSNKSVVDESRFAGVFDADIGVEGQLLSPFDRNVQTLDAMTSTDTKLPREIANKIALSPTLMAKLENYHKAGWTLQFHPGSEMPDTGPGVPEIDETKKGFVFSIDEARENPDAFLRAFTQIILYNEGDMLKMLNEEDVFEANVSQEMMDRIEAEWSGAGPLRPSDPTAPLSVNTRDGAESDIF